ncbi:MAG: neprosin family prolyl endopeptidase [Capsulimonadaceae bacterium]
MHKYAHAFQTVNNYGGHSFANIWDPAVGSQVFSLSQHWYAGGDPVQTVECGWQVFPQQYGSTLPVLFIYWTADDYQHTGNYNLDKPAFVQTNNAWALGGALNTISITDGQQYELEILWNLQGGNWWLYLQGTTAANAVGYFPTSLFNGGQMATNATEIDYGGEVVDATSWPPMGSGAFANAGPNVAAYHRDIYFFPAGAATAQPANLTPEQPSPSCFTIAVNSGPDPWNEYFYFGGPGGGGCQ